VHSHLVTARRLKSFHAIIGPVSPRRSDAVIAAGQAAPMVHIVKCLIDLLRRPQIPAHTGHKSGISAANLAQTGPAEWIF
jgi:hypothetical protein